MTARILACLMLAGLLSAALGAVTVNVSSESQLRGAIATINGSSAAQDEIILAAGTYTFGTPSTAYVITKNTAGSRVIIRGASSGAAGTTIIDAAGQARVFHVQSTGTVTVEFRDLTIKGGRASDDGATVAEAWGGGILNRRSGTSATTSSIELLRVTLQGCIAQGEDGTGGGTTAQANAADARGGGIYSRGGTVKITQSTITGCTAWGGDGADPDYNKNGGAGGNGFGGAIYLHNGTLTVMGATFSSNLANGGDGGYGGDGDSASGTGAAGGKGGDSGAACGGALYVNNGSASITIATFNDNEAGSGSFGGDGGYSEDKADGADGGACGPAQGGAIYVVAGTVNISDGTVTSNRATSYFGGLGSDGGWGDNSAGRNAGNGGAGGVAQGGGIYNETGSLTLLRCKIDGNKAWGGDGGDGGEGGDGDAFDISSARGGDGGNGGNGGPAQGGGIYAYRGTTALTDCSVSSNICQGGGDYWTTQFAGVGGYGDGAGTGGAGGSGGDGGPALGGGVYVDTAGVNFSALRCTLAGNVCQAGESQQGEWGGDGGATGKGGPGGNGGLGGAARGGGLYRNGGSNTVTLTQVTIDANILVGGLASDGGDGGDGHGGEVGGAGGTGGSGGAADGCGLYVVAGNTTVSNSTVTSNTGTAGAAGVGGAGGSSGAGGALGAAGSQPVPQGGGGMRVAGTFTSTSTIWGLNSATTGPDFSGVLTANYSLFSNAAGATITGANNKLNMAPQVAALADNGGATKTRALNGGSAAIDAGSNPLALTTDQRGAGYDRASPTGSPDIGAFEAQVAPTVAAPVINTPGSSVTVSSTSFDFIGTAPAGAIVRAYIDANGNGVLDITERSAVYGQANLAAGVTAFTVNVTLPANATTTYLLTAEVATVESGAAVAPDVTHDSSAPAAPVITSPASVVTVSALTFDIQGTTEADALVTIYEDTNGNGVLDSGEPVSQVQQLSGGATAFSINVNLQSSQDNFFVATATDSAGNASTAAVVPKITHAASAAIAPPVVTSPNAPVTLNANSINIAGTAQAGSLVRVYVDINGDGVINGADSVAGSQQLAAGVTAFAVMVPLAQNQVNRFVVTADDGAGNESAATAVAPITEAPTILGGTGGGGGGGGGGGCSAVPAGAPLLMALLPLLAALRRRRKQ